MGAVLREEGAGTVHNRQDHVEMVREQDGTSCCKMMMEFNGANEVSTTANGDI